MVYGDFRCFTLWQHYWSVGLYCWSMVNHLNPRLVVYNFCKHYFYGDFRCFTLWQHYWSIGIYSWSVVNHLNPRLVVYNFCKHYFYGDFRCFTLWQHYWSIGIYCWSMVNHLNPRLVVYNFCKHYFAHCLGLLNSSPHGQNGHYFTDNIFRCIFVNEKFGILFKISLTFVLKDTIDDNPALV